MPTTLRNAVITSVLLLAAMTPAYAGTALFTSASDTVKIPESPDISGDGSLTYSGNTLTLDMAGASEGIWLLPDLGAVTAGDCVATLWFSSAPSPGTSDGDGIALSMQPGTYTDQELRVFFGRESGETVVIAGRDAMSAVISFQFPATCLGLRLAREDDQVKFAWHDGTAWQGLGNYTLNSGAETQTMHFALVGANGGGDPAYDVDEISVTSANIDDANKPVVNSAAVGGYGTLETAGTGSDEIALVRVGGTRYQMGFWYGYLLAEDIRACADALFTAAGYTDTEYDTFKGLLWNSAYFDTEAYESELQGMVDGCAAAVVEGQAASGSEITLEELIRVQLVPDMSEFQCGLYAAWGAATANGHLYQLRNLDWNMDFGIQDYPSVAIYEPNDGNRHSVIGFAGLIGCAVGGMCDKGIAVSEIMGSFGDTEDYTTVAGIPFPFLLRDCIYHDETLAEALTRIQNAERTNQYHYGISGLDGSGDEDARLLFTSDSRYDEFGGGDAVLPHPYHSPFYTPLTDVVYWKGADGSGNENLYNAINARYGTIDDTEAQEIAVADGVSTTLVSIVYDCTSLDFWVAYANGLDRATNQTFVPFDLTGANVTYSLGDEFAVLDSDFYDGMLDDRSGYGSDQRMAFFAASSNDATRVAFWAVNRTNYNTAFYTVEIGDPSSWERLSEDIAQVPDAPIAWTPDDLYLLVGPYRIPVTGPQRGELLTHTVHGYDLDDTTATLLASDNWLVTHEQGDMVALPVLADGAEDPTREPVVMTDFASAGHLSVDWPAVARDASAVGFAAYDGSPDGIQPDCGDVYVLPSFDAIIAAPKRPGTYVSTLAPTALDDPILNPIRVNENGVDNFAHVPKFSQDNSLTFFCEDWNNVFRDSDFFGTLAVADFDVMLGKSSGAGEDVRFAGTGNQFISGVTGGGTRVIYQKDDTPGVLHLYVATLRVETEVEGDEYTGGGAVNAIETTEPQEVNDASGTVIEIDTGVVIDFPDAEEQEIEISTPVEPPTEAQLPDEDEDGNPDVDDIPITREFGPSGTTFAPPVEVTITYTDAEVAGLDESALRVFLFNGALDEYEEVTTITGRNTVNNTITFTVDHFSKYGLGALLDTDGDGTPDRDDGDDDNDGDPDGTDPNPLDTDNDGVDNADDPDDDCDGTPDGDDTYPLDTDNDGTPNNIDNDDDADGIDDSVDLYLFDTDNDGERNDVDDDDDNDGYTDEEELLAGTDPLDSDDNPAAVPVGATFALLAFMLLVTALGFKRLRQVKQNT